MKRVAHILFIILAVLLLLNVALLITLNIPSVQERLVKKVTDVISEQTGTEISIQHIQIDLFNGVFAQQVYVEDTHQDTLLFVDHLQVDFSPWKLYRNNKVHLKKVALSDFLVRLTKESDSTEYNYQFLIDAFASKDEETDSTPSKFHLIIDDIALINGRFHHDIFSVPDTSKLFDVNHLAVDSINTSIAFDMQLPQQIDANIDHLSAKEISGLTIRNIRSDIHLDLDSLMLRTDEMNLLTTQSDITLKEVQYRIPETIIDGEIVQTTIVGSDFRCFTSFLNKWNDSLNLQASTHIQFPKITVEKLKADLGGSITLNANGVEMVDCTLWDSTAYTIKQLELSASQSTTNTIKKNLQMDLPSIIDSLLPAKLLLDADGTLPDIVTKLYLSSAVGNIFTSGNIHYLHNAQRLEADNNWLVEASSLQPILHADIIKGAKGIIESHLRWNLNEMPDLAILATIDSLNLQNHIYDTLHINVSYDRNKHLVSDITSADTCLNLTLKADIRNLLDDTMETHISTEITNLMPYPLHFTDTLQQLAFRGKIHIDGRGSNLNNWLGQIKIDSLQIKKDSLASLQYKSIQLSQTQKGNKKELSLNSPILTGKISGTYHLDSLPINQLLHPYLPSLFKTAEKANGDDFTFSFDIDDLDATMDFLSIPLHQKGIAHIDGTLSSSNSDIKLNIRSPHLEYNDLLLSESNISAQTGKGQLGIDLVTQLFPDKEENFSAQLTSHLNIRNDSIFSKLKSITQPDTTFLQGEVHNAISFHELTDSTYKIVANIFPSTIRINEQTILLHPSTININSNNIAVENVGMELEGKPIFLANGTISDKISDTLDISVENLQLRTILSMLLINDIPADCSFSGNLKSSAILGEQSRFFTRNFRADSITYQEMFLGNMTTKAMWDNSRGGVFAKMELERDHHHLMDIKGVVIPAQQLVHMKALIDSFPLELAMPFAHEYVSDLQGKIATNITIDGKITSPDIKGSVHFIDTKAKVNYTGVTYSISDSITLAGNYFYAKRFKVKDHNGNSLLFDGEITHEQFKEFNYRMKLNMRNFALLNNPKARNKMVYGTFNVNGNNLLLEGTEEKASITGSLSNAENTNVNIILPESFTEAYSNDNIVYVKSADQERTEQEEERKDTIGRFDLSADLTIGLSDQATFYVNVADGAMIRGNGNLQLIYEDGDIELFNRFTVSDGYMKVRLSGLPTKKFAIQNGSYVEFNGDPMKLKFNATASYALTADLSTLSSSFSSLGLGSTRVPVNCDLSASGDLSNLSLSYDINLPKADENIKQSVNSIINTDNIRIKEFAYLIGLGMFNDPSGQVENDMLMSFASSSLSSTLNNVLGDVLKDKVTIGAGINSAQDDFSDMEVSVSVSTKLFNDRLLLSTNLGYQNQANNSNSSSFLGDFDAEYLLGKSGMFRIKGYNHTNNDFYRSSNNTQGLGFTFVRESKTLNTLFKLKNNYAKPDSTRADSTKRRRREHEEK